MKDTERRDAQHLVDALARAQWSASGSTCPVCHRPKTHGHTCACPIGLGVGKIGPRLLRAEVQPHEPESIRIGDRFRFSVVLLQDIAGREGMQTATVTLVGVERGADDISVLALAEDGA